VFTSLANGTIDCQAFAYQGVLKLVNPARSLAGLLFISNRRTSRLSQNDTTYALLKCRQVLKLLPISKSSWYAGIREGKYPKPANIAGGRSVFWRSSDIDALIESAAPVIRPK
jgi:predicted DNA-binding transcriptional regulator AlpA